MQKCLNMIVISNFCPFGGAGNYVGNNEKKKSAFQQIFKPMRAFCDEKFEILNISCSILKVTKKCGKINKDGNRIQKNN